MKLISIIKPDTYRQLRKRDDKSTMNKVLEYMALEHPIVQYDLVEGKRSALNASVYADPDTIKDLATKIEELLADPVKREVIGKYGWKRMQDELKW